MFKESSVSSCINQLSFVSPCNYMFKVSFVSPCMFLFSMFSIPLYLLCVLCIPLYLLGVLCICSRCPLNTPVFTRCPRIPLYLLGVLCISCLFKVSSEPHCIYQVSSVSPCIYQDQVSSVSLCIFQVSSVSPCIAACPRLKTLRLEENCLALEAVPSELFSDRYGLRTHIVSKEPIWKALTIYYLKYDWQLSSRKSWLH